MRAPRSSALTAAWFFAFDVPHFADHREQERGGQAKEHETFVQGTKQTAADKPCRVIPGRRETTNPESLFGFSSY